MAAQYNWSDHEFRDECSESLNLAINIVADVLHTLCTEVHQEQRSDLNGDDQITAADAVIALRITVSGGYSDEADAQRAPAACWQNAEDNAVGAWL